MNYKIVYEYKSLATKQALLSDKSLFRLPHMMTAEEACSFFRLPLYQSGMSAIKETKSFYHEERLNPKVTNKSGIKLGNLYGHSETFVGLPKNHFSLHTLIVGTPGMGKTTFSLNLLLQFFQRHIPFLAIEPTKTEYRALIDAIPKIQIFTPGKSGVSPLIINPFIPPPGIALERYRPNLISAFQAAFSMTTPLDSIFLDAVNKCYNKYGWDDNTTAEDTHCLHFGLREFIGVFKQEMQRSDYRGDVRGNVLTGGLFRLMNLINQNSNIFDNIHSLNIADLMEAPSIIELNAIDNAEQKALIIVLLLINICAYIKQRFCCEECCCHRYRVVVASEVCKGSSIDAADFGYW